MTKTQPEEQKSGGIRQFITELRIEWDKITKPQVKEWRMSTIVVFIFTLLMTAIMFCYDFFMSWAFDQFIYGK